MGFGNLAATSIERYTRSAELAGVGLLAAGSYAIQYGMAILDASGTLSLAAYAVVPHTAAFSGVGELNSSVIQQFQNAVNMQSLGTLSAIVEVASSQLPYTLPFLLGDGSTPSLLGATVYTQSNVYPTNTAANWSGMNDGSAAGNLTTQTGTNNGSGNYIRADCGSVMYVHHIVIGYDYLNNMPGGWGVSYTEGLLVQTSNDASSWTTVDTTPVYASSGSSNGLVTISINTACRYVQLAEPTTDYMATLEFQVWTVP